MTPKTLEERAREWLLSEFGSVEELGSAIESLTAILQSAIDETLADWVELVRELLAHIDAVEAVKDLTDGRGVPYSFEAIGLKKTAEQCFAMLAPGGVATIIGMIQTRPQAAGQADDPQRPVLAPVGCAGRVTSFAETSDGRYLITLAEQLAGLKEKGPVPPERLAALLQKPFSAAALSEAVRTALTAPRKASRVSMPAS